MLCAQDMPNGVVSGDDQFAEQDTCQGDSGSPSKLGTQFLFCTNWCEPNTILVILPSKGGKWQQDLQVGVGEHLYFLIKMAQIVVLPLTVYPSQKNYLGSELGHRVSLSVRLYNI